MDRIHFDKKLVVIKEIQRFNGYVDNMILKLVKKQKWVKKIRPVSICTMYMCSASQNY